MKKYFNIILLLILISFSSCTEAVNPELIIGEERVEPGVLFIFEGAVKDMIMPSSLHLSENETHVHIEARVNWGDDDLPKGAVPNGFIPYLYINAKVINENTGLSTFIDLLPHINLIDNFHYARNISLPGSIDDLYTVIFNVVPPTDVDLSLHKDWIDSYGTYFINSQKFKYTQVDFSDIARANRR